MWKVTSSVPTPERVLAVALARAGILGAALTGALQIVALDELLVAGQQVGQLSSVQHGRSVPVQGILGAGQGDRLSQLMRRDAIENLSGLLIRESSKRHKQLRRLGSVTESHLLHLHLSIDTKGKAQKTCSPSVDSPHFRVELDEIVRAKRVVHHLLSL